MKNKSVVNAKISFLIVALVFSSIKCYSQYLPLSGGSLTGSLTVTAGNQIQIPYLGFNSPTSQPATSNNVAIFPNSSSGSLDIIGWGNGWHFVPNMGYSYPSAVFSIDPAGNTDISGNVNIGGTNSSIYKLETLGMVSSSLNGESGFHIYNGGGVSEWLIHQKSQTDNNFNISRLNSGIQTDYFTINSNGNIGIGTTDNASWQLANSNYKLAVGGGMIATSVTVKLTSAWPDYVFNSSYQLKPLSDIKIYIDQNHHLPEMPSAAEVEKDGLNLGEMNKLLTKKVEELTLYLIAKDKLDTEKDERIKKLEQQMEQLTKSIKN